MTTSTRPDPTFTVVGAATTPSTGKRRRRTHGVGDPHPMPWVYVVLTGGLVVLVGPFLWMLLGSFRPDRELKATPPAWLPQDPTLDNYRTLFTQLDFPTYFLNSAVVALAVTLGNLVFCSMLGYALAKLAFPGKRVIFALVLGTLMVPGVVTFIPLFVLVSNLGLVNTYPGLIFPFVAGPFGVFLMRQFIQSLPDELIHAARVDGAGEWRIFASVMLPLCKPALATLAIISFIAHWESFLDPVVFLHSPENFTIAIGLWFFKAQPMQAERPVAHLLMAASLHDVGKVAVPHDILAKSGPLDETEWAVMREHTIAGEQIDTVVVTVDVTLSGGVNGTSKRTLWVSQKYRLPVKQHEEAVRAGWLPASGGEPQLVTTRAVASRAAPRKAGRADMRAPSEGQVRLT